MVQPFKFEALADGSANVYKEERFIGNIQNAADIGLYCTHENDREMWTADEKFFYCPDCGKTSK